MSAAKSSPPPAASPAETAPPSPVSQTKALPDLLEHAAVEKSAAVKPAESSEGEEVASDPNSADLMEELDVDKCLVWKPPEEEGPDIRGGTVDALIIQATKATRNGGRLRWVYSRGENV